MQTNFKEIKENVLACYEKMLQTVKKSGFPEEDTTLRALAAQTEKIKDDRFCLLIAGEAKSGKSTFINAYLGTEILPMDVRQCTSAVVEIGYGDEFCLKATYADDRVVTVTGEHAINEFLQKNAALDDKYRDIPVPTINNEIIIKHKGRKILEAEIKDLLEGVRRENIHRLPEDQYEKKIRDYIKERQVHWQDLVVKMNIFYPFRDEDMKGIRIIDSPGVNAAGKVGDATAKYIESADAIMFLRPITGVAIEANSFKEFLESKSVDRNKNAMFLVLTRTASESPDTINRAYEEFVNMFGTMKTDTRHGIIKEQIIPVDSKAELYFNKFQNMSTPEIGTYIKQLRQEQKAEAFLSLAWADACGDKEQLQNELKRISNFEDIDLALNRFGRKAQYIAFSEFLGRILKMYEKINVTLKDNIDSYSLKAEDPTKLAVKIAEVKAELVDIENRLEEKTDEIEHKYSGSNSVIKKESDKISEKFRKEIEKLDADHSESIDELEKITFRMIDQINEFQDHLQKEVVKECNEALQIALGNKTKIEFHTLAPDLTPEIVEDLKEKAKKGAKVRVPYETGLTFKRTEYTSEFSQSRFYKLFKESIIERLEDIRNQAVREMRAFVAHTVKAYTFELSKNAGIKRNELEKIKLEKKNADEIYQRITELKNELIAITDAQKYVEELKGGIDGIV